MSDSSRKSVVVVGGGFQGLTACQLLGRAGHCVTLIERSPQVGGVLASSEMEGLFLDRGCHVFENSSSEVTRLMIDILGDEILPIDFRYASVTEGKKVDGVAVPDFTKAERSRRDRMVMEMINAAAESDGRREGTLQDALLHRYGETIAHALSVPIKKIALTAPEMLDASALEILLVSRVRVLEDPPAMLLKQIGALDERIAVPSQAMPMRFYAEAAATFPHRIYYPRGRGMRTYCDLAQAMLRKLGVEFHLGTEVVSLSPAPNGRNAQVAIGVDTGAVFEADYLLWAIDPGPLTKLLFGTNPLAEFAHRVPMILYYFLVPASIRPAYTYLHDFTEERLTFRASSPGFYGQQRNHDGLSYLLVEVPTPEESARWASPETDAPRVWRELLELGMVNLDAPTRTIIHRTPGSYPLHRPGYTHALDTLTGHIEAAWPGVIVGDGTAFSKVSIVQELRSRFSELAI